MSLREVSSSTPFLAKKGSAAPANPGVARGGPAGPSLRPIESDGEISLESAPAAAPADIAASASGKRTLETAPAASLLPFNLLRKKYRPDAVPDLVDDELDIAPMDFVAFSDLKPEPKQQAELALRVNSEARVKSEAVTEPNPYPTVDAKPALELKAPRPSEPEAAPRLDAPTLTPSLNPEWRVGIETPVPIQPAVARDTSAKRNSSGGWLFPLGALAAAFAALVVGWNMTNPDFDLGSWLAPETASTSESVREAAGPDATPTAVEPPPPIEETPAVVASPAPVEPEAPIPTQPESTAATNAPVEPEPTPSTSLPSTLREPNLSPPANSAADGAGATTAGETLAATPVKPTVDVVRLEANGDAVIAGRAAPNTELIVLDNGEPIGTVQADAFGEWVFVPEVALPIGDHEFALVVKSVQESVSLPAPSTPSLPPAPTLTPELEPALAVPDSEFPEAVPAIPSGAVIGGDAPDIGTKVAPTTGEGNAADQLIPVPVRKPESTDFGSAPTDGQAEAEVEVPAPPHEDVSAANTPVTKTPVTNTAAAKTADFVVQLASVKTQAGAEQEWRRLKQKFPEILSGMVPALAEVKLVDYGTVIRVRTGSFDSQRDAATLCAQLAEKRQACLVVKTPGGT